MRRIQHIEVEIPFGKSLIQAVKWRGVELTNRVEIDGVGDEPETDAVVAALDGDPQLTDDHLIADDLGEGAANFEGAPLPRGRRFPPLLSVSASCHPNHAGSLAR